MLRLEVAPIGVEVMEGWGIVLCVRTVVYSCYGYF